MSGHSGTYGWVFGQIRVDPDRREHHLHARPRPQRLARRRQDVLRALRGTHGDHHGLWIDPAKPATLYSANDGGFYLSDDAGKSWNYARAAGGVQFYNVTLDSSTPAWAYGSIQDDGSRRGRIDLSARAAIRMPAVEWTTLPGARARITPSTPPIPTSSISHGFYGNFTRTERRAAASAPHRRHRGGARAADADAASPRNIRPQSADAELRAQWMAPIITSRHEPGVIYAGYQFVYRSAESRRRRGSGSART